MYNNLRYAINIVIVIFFSIYSISCCHPVETKSVVENKSPYQSTVFVLVMNMDPENNLEDPYQMGSGVAIADGRHVLTAAHVCEFENSIDSRIEAVNWEGYASSGKVVKIDRYNDLCLIKISAKFKSAKIADISPEIGERLYSSGYPLAYFEPKQPILLDGYYSGTNKFGSMLTTIPVARGSSGGPVFNSDGEIVGIIISEFKEFENISFSASLEKVRNFVIEK